MTNGARSDIEATLIAYATALDTKDWDLFRSLFTEDCVFDAGNGVFHGVEPLTEHMRALHDPLDGCRHHLGNFVVEVDGDLARSTCYLDALLVRRDHPDGPTLRVTGSYDDELVLRSGRWSMRRRTFRWLWSEGNHRLIARR